MHLWKKTREKPLLTLYIWIVVFGAIFISSHFPVFFQLSQMSIFIHIMRKPFYITMDNTFHTKQKIQISSFSSKNVCSKSSKN